MSNDDPKALLKERRTMKITNLLQGRWFDDVEKQL